MKVISTFVSAGPKFTCGAYGQIAFSYEEAQTGGEILGELLLRGQPIGLIDSMIAGIAIEHDEAILTRNPKDFEKVSEIEVKTY